MSHGKLRADKTCLNCGHYVEERFCPHCGQENIETRQPFYFLFTHFIEDFTHYDGQFWKTIKYLLFRPGRLTTEYLSGKRQQYVAPVKLYIFVSFITFFLSSILSSDTNSTANTQDENITKEQVSEGKKTAIQQVKVLESTGLLSKENTQKAIDKIENQRPDEVNVLSDNSGNEISIGSKSLEEYDAEIKKENSFFGKLFRPVVVKFFHLKEQGLTTKQIRDKFSETFIHTLPKALFIYLPVFAFILWLFHDKKKWWYFDHGIFTLHYFSFLLIYILIATILNFIDNLFDNFFVAAIQFIAFLAIIVYSMVYFFIAHHQVYQTKKRITILKGFLIFLVNLLCMLILLLGLIGLSFLMIH